MAQTGQNPWLRSGWKIQPTRIGYCSNTNWTRRFRCVDSNDSFMHVQFHYCRVLRVEPCHWWDELYRRSSWAVELLAALVIEHNQVETISCVSRSLCLAWELDGWCWFKNPSVLLTKVISKIHHNIVINTKNSHFVTLVANLMCRKIEIWQSQNETWRIPLSKAVESVD